MSEAEASKPTSLCSVGDVNGLQKPVGGATDITSNGDVAKRDKQLHDVTGLEQSLISPRAKRLERIWPG